MRARKAASVRQLIISFTACQWEMCLLVDHFLLFGLALKKAIEMAMKEFLRAKRREELSNLIGNCEDFALTLEELEKG